MKSRGRRGVSEFLDTSRRLPPAFESDLDEFQVDLERDVSRVSRGPLEPLSRRPVASRPLDRFPAKQVFKRLYSKPTARDLAELKRLRFSAPSAVKACVHRKERREVLFALHRAGFAGSGPGKRRPKGQRYRRTPESQYRC